MTDVNHDLEKKLAGRTVVASVSGGKDSAAMSLWLTEQGIEHLRVFMDTGWEHPRTYDYISGELMDALGPIIILKPPLLMMDLCRKKGMFPSRTRRFCTQELKVKPIIQYIGGLQDQGHEVVNAIGIRAGESLARSKMNEWEWQESYDAEVWRPIIRWTEKEVIDIHTLHGLRPNPIYLDGASRVGCWPCIFSRKDEIRLVADIDHARIDTIRLLEAEVQETARLRYEAKGETFESLGFNRPCFFQAMGALRTEGKDGRCVPIDEVVAWSRTGQGGRQYEMFAPAREEGCVRWGLCESTAER